MESITINGEEYVKVNKGTDGDYVIVRSRDQGVMCGHLVAIDKAARAVTLREARQIWAYKGGLCLPDIARHGLRDGSRLSDVSPGETEVLGACGVMRVADPAAMKGWPADKAGRS